MNILLPNGDGLMSNKPAKSQALAQTISVKRTRILIHSFFAVTVMVAMLIASAANAQNFRFNNVSIEGNQRIETATILSFADIARGEALTGGQLNDAAQRIRATGLFEEVDIIPQGNTLVIRVVEYPTVNRINIEGNRRLKDAELERVVRSQPRRVYSPSQAEADAAAIADAYVQDGRLAATVTPRIIRRSDNRVDLVFEVFEGGVVEIERISFVGNRSFSDRRLRRVLETKQAGLLRALVARDTFVADRIEFDKQVLTDFYRSRGYVDFQVQNVDANLTRERDGFLLTFNIQEGQKFKFGEITTVSNIAEADSDEFQKTLKLKPGVVYSPILIESSIARLERLALKKGINFLRVEPNIIRNDRDLTLDVEFVLTRGPRIFVERIDIEGNTTTLDRVVRNKFRVVEGDPFNPRLIRESAERIRALGFFSNANVDAREGSSPDQVVIDVDVAEQPTGSLSFGANFNTATGFGVLASFRERNFLGRGQTLNFGVSTAENNRNFTFNFVEPNLLGRELQAGVAFEYGTTNNENALYDTERLSFSPSIRFPVSDNGLLGLNFKLLGTDISDVQTTSAVINGEAAVGRTFAKSLGYSYSFDNRRSGLNPNAGVVLRFGQDFGFVDDGNFIKTTALLGAETKVLSEEVTLRATLEGGALQYFGGVNSRVTDRFFLGSRVMRGFEPGGIGPRDAATNDALGGNLFAVARLEAEFPLGLPEEYGISGGVFLDVGSLWEVGETFGATIDGNDFAARSVVGASLFWDTPIGPLRFNFTRALSKETFDVEQTFDLTISTSF